MTPIAIFVDRQYQSDRVIREPHQLQAGLRRTQSFDADYLQSDLERELVRNLRTPWREASTPSSRLVR
jgi:hypothetical protein